MDIIEEREFARWLEEVSGKISEARVMNLYSRTLYVFSLDEKRLSIKDIDVVKFAEPFQANNGEIMRFKRVRKSRDDRTGVVYATEGLKSYKELIRKQSVLKEAEVVFEDADDYTTVLVQFKSNVSIYPHWTYALYLQYDVVLDGNGKHLFFTGAVQPSDFEKLEELGLKEGHKEKEVEICIWSKKQTPFPVWFFDASKHCYYPSPELAKPDKQGRGFYEFRKILPVEMHKNRASYFSVFANASTS